MADSVTAYEVGDAIAAYLVAEDDEHRVTTGWVVIAMTQGVDDEAGGADYRLIPAPSQSYATTDGLVNIARRIQQDVWDTEEDE